MRMFAQQIIKLFYYLFTTCTLHIHNNNKITVWLFFCCVLEKVLAEILGVGESPPLVKLILDITTTIYYNHGSCTQQ